MKKILIFTFLSFICIYPKVIAQDLNQVQINYIKGLAKNVHVDDSYKNGRWDPLLEVIGDKDIVLLGELNHGAKEIFLTRNDLIKQLHQQLNFDVILFESGFGEVGTVDLQKDALNHKQMTYGLFGPWRTQEFEDLMLYVKSNKMSIGGVDVQKTGSNFKKLLYKLSVSKSIDTSLYYNIEQRFNRQKKLLTNRKAKFDDLKDSTQRLIGDYQTLLNAFRKGTPQENGKANLLVERTIENRLKYLHYFLDFTKTKDWSKRWKDRDEMMALNVKWLIEHFYQGKKVIVVAHNFHIAKFNEKEEVMGEFLSKAYGSRMYVLGAFAGSGSYADNSGKEKPMKSIDSTGVDMRTIIESLEGKTHFMDISKEKPSPSNTFLFEKIIVNDSFIDLYGSNQLVVSKHFDGILLIDKISLPEK
ncbi:MAG: erythromycin esterase family protein [Bacteroidota bacterium]